MFNFFVLIVVGVHAQKYEKPHQAIQLLSPVEKDYSAHVKSVSFFLLILDYTVLFEFLSNEFLLISLVCAHNDNLHGYRTMKNRRNIKTHFWEHKYVRGSLVYFLS